MRGERHVPVRHTPLTLETIHRIGLDTLLLKLRVDMQVRSLKSARSGLESYPATVKSGPGLRGRLSSR